MRIIKFLKFLIPLLMLTGKIYSQGSERSKPFITLTLFYVDNSEGFDNDPLNSGLNNEIKDELRQKLDAASSMPDNYFFLVACNGEDPTQHSDLNTYRQSESLRKYLGKPSREASYAAEKLAIRESFSQYPIRIKKSVEVYLFLSGFALNQLTKKIDELPTPLTIPKEIGIFLNNKDAKINVYVCSNKEAVEKLSSDKIKSYFTFCNSELRLANINVEVLPF
ncbi:MAG TPA: hypothetical protein VJY62_22510 [Bacteroidia bacterium]|nr:hypothetical protein [Bacteroidia bacterium]